MANFLDTRFFRFVRHKFMQRLFFAILFIGFAITSGIIGFIIIEGYTASEAFYMTIITLSTVGFQEVRPLSHEGRMFTAFLIIFNIGALTYSVSVIGAFIFEGDLQSVIKENQMEKELKELKNHIIVCGYGRLGKIVCDDLENAESQLLIVEQNEKTIEELASGGKLYLSADATTDDSILSMRIKHAKTLITTFHSDAANIFVVLAAREISPDLKIISRASEEANVSKLKLAGANHVIIPEDIGGAYIASMVVGKENVAIGKWEY